MANEKILVVDDDTNICELLRLYLTKEGYQVTTANDGEEGLDKFNQVKPDMVLLDVMMPKMDGLEVCRRIRKLGNTPVMMLTAKGETFDKVLGLELGADDYMVKPFDTKEVVARIKAVLRRCTTTTAQTESTEGVIEFDNLRLDMNSYELRVKGKVVEAPPKELELLNCLAPTPTVFTPATSCWTRCGALSTTVTAAPSMSMSSACAKSWRALPTSGSSRPSGAWAISSRCVSNAQKYFGHLLFDGGHPAGAGHGGAGLLRVAAVQPLFCPGAVRHAGQRGGCDAARGGLYRAAGGSAQGGRAGCPEHQAGDYRRERRGLPVFHR